MSEPVAVVVPAPSTALVIVDVDSTVLTVGSRTRASVLVLDRQGQPIAGKSPAWSSTAPEVLSVSSGGVAVAVAPGLAQVVATVDGVRGERDVVVRPLPAVALVSIDLAVTSFTVGDTATATVRAYDINGDEVSGRAVTWSVDGSPTVVSVSSSGRLTALAPGNATLVARVDSAEGRVDLQVVARPVSDAAVASVAVSLSSLTLRVGETLQASATAFDSAGQVVAPRAVTWSSTAGTGVVTVSATGRVTGVAAGSAQVGATIDGVRGVAALQVLDSASSGGHVTLPALPETLSFTFPVVTGRQWVVRAGDNLQTALNNAQRGDEVVLQAGATFTGNFTLPPKPGSPSDGWIVVRSDRLAQLPPQGTRVTPAHAALMPTVMSANTTAALSTPVNSRGWWIAGIEFTIAPPVTHVIGRVVALGVGGGAQNSLSVVPSDLVLDRVYIHPQANQHVQRCLELNSARTAVQDSWLSECHAKGFDSQAIVGWNGPGPFRIVNNMLAGAGENIMFGGADPVIRDLIPSDIQLSRNHIYTPPSWKGVWTKKNLVETKNVQRFLIEANVLDGSWTDGQVGYAFVLKVANQSGKCTWCAARDITIRDNLVRNVGGGFGITGREGSNPHPVGELLNRLLIENNYVENVNVAPFTGDARLVSIMQNTQNVVIRRNTMTAPGALAQFLNLGSIPAATNFAFEQNVMSYGTYGFFSSKYGIGEASLQGFAGTVSFAGNVLIGAQKNGYPRSRFVASLAAAQALGVGADKGRVDAATLNVVVP